MDTNDYYALIGPVMVVFIAIEAAITRRRGRRGQHLPDTLANLSTGMGQVLIGVFTGGFILWVYEGFRGACGLVQWPIGSPWPWVLAFVGVDLCYYWFHRSSHAVAVLWAVHEVHHQSNEMNLSVAVRQTYFSDFTAFLFFWPLPLLGVPDGPFFFAVGVLSLYEAFLHNEAIDGHRVWGWVFNTPRWHRVHHACNERYLDRNFASTLIVWDRLFGTFTTPSTGSEAPVYGTVRPFASHNPVWAQIAPIAALGRRVAGAPGLVGALEVLLRSPRWVAPWEQGDDGARPAAPQPRPARIEATTAMKVHVVVQAMGLATAGQALLRLWASAPLAAEVAGVALLIAGTVTVGGLLERRPWAPIAEGARLVAVVPAGVFVERALGSRGATWVALAWAVCGLLTLLAGLRSGEARREAGKAEREGARAAT